MGACVPRKGKVLIVLLAHHDIKSATPAAKSIQNRPYVKRTLKPETAV